MPRHLFPLLIPKFYSDDKVLPEFQGEFLTSFDQQFLYGFGIEGFRAVVHDPDNIAPFYPHSKTNSKFHENAESTLPDEYQAFMDKFESVVLIAFGTTFMPSEKDMMHLFEMVKLADPTKMGFIISLKEKLTSFAKIKEANLPNVFLSKWVPQKEILSQDKLHLFITHGGANSVFESLYFGTPMLGFGQEADQHGMMFRL